ncbi:hypothetical protein P0E49_13900 [Enterococcus faecalis]|nr:hypothetical protein [Enterococcus faecalis]
MREQARRAWRERGMDGASRNPYNKDDPRFFMWRNHFEEAKWEDEAFDECDFGVDDE